MNLFRFNENFCLINEQNTSNPYKKDGVFRWQGDEETCIFILEILSSCENKEQFFYALECESDRITDPICFNNLKYWDLETIMYSCFYFLFENQDPKNKSRLLSFNYNLIFSFLVSPFFSNEITLLLKYNDFLNFLTKNTNITIIAIELSFLFHIDFANKSKYFHVIENLFKLLEIKKPNLYAEYAFQDKNGDSLHKLINFIPFFIYL